MVSLEDALIAHDFDTWNYPKEETFLGDIMSLTLWEATCGEASSLYVLYVYLGGNLKSAGNYKDFGPIIKLKF